MARSLVETPQSDTSCTRVEQLGGYRVDQPGRVRRHY